MIKRQNTHWDEVVHPGPYNWATYLRFSADGSKQALDEARQLVVADHLTASAASGVRELKLRVEPDTWCVGLSLIVEGPDRELALDFSVVAALGGLAQAGVALDHTHVLKSNVAEEQTLLDLCKSGAANNVQDTDFSVNPQPINNLFHGLAVLHHPDLTIPGLRSAAA